MTVWMIDVYVNKPTPGAASFYLFNKIYIKNEPHALIITVIS